MLDINLLRENPEVVIKDLEKRQAENMIPWVDQVKKADSKWRESKQGLDELKHERNKAAELIASIKDNKAEKSRLISEMKDINMRIKELEVFNREQFEKRQYFLDRLPNIMHKSVVYGADANDNVEFERYGKLPVFDFVPKDHIDLMLELDLLELDRAAKVSGSRFYYLKGQAVLLDIALIRYALDVVQDEGFQIFTPPVLVRKKALYGTGFLPLGGEDIYKIEGEDLALVGTSEVPLGAFHMDEILDGNKLPFRYAGFSPCFRTEAGSHGKDTKGIFRVHKFHKVEQFSFTRPEDSWDEHELLKKNAEILFQGLNIPYRIMNICTGDLGGVAAKKYDLEAWLAGQGKYREVVSCSNCTDYQARRLKIRFRDNTSEKPRYVHTLNATALATNRVMIAIMENNQREDGSVAIPEALWKYTGFKEIRKP
ncbi:MAG: serine--tRNA ligase [Candidatus Hodarchaeales archaeon]|jgi:seryl-tRNA synthetase